MRLVILGDPVEHSLSPVLHTTALRLSGLVGTYERRRVDAAGMAQALSDIRRGALDGANVTMPHKELAAELCDRLAPAALRAGAVNTLVRVGGQVVGHNTDIQGIREAWRDAGLPESGPILVLGAGGAAAAALLATDGRPVAISSRRKEAARAVIARVEITAEVVEWGTPIADSVVINATPLGMRGEPLPAAVAEAAIGLFDMAYGPDTTPGVAAATARGLPVADGTRMLLHQAAAAFELWTGHRAPIGAMAAAISR